MALVSFLGPGAIASFTYAQTVYLLPMSRRRDTPSARRCRPPRQGAQRRQVEELRDEQRAEARQSAESRALRLEELLRLLG